MKKIIIAAVFNISTIASFAQNNVGIGTVTPDSSALLHLASTQKGFLVPRMDSAQRSQIVSPAQGLLVYQVKTNPGFYYYSGNTWYKVGGGGNEWMTNAVNDLYTNRNVGIANNNPTEKLDITGNIKTSGNILTSGEIKPGGTAGLASQVLTATGSGSMVWANVPTEATVDESFGSGTWGDCSVNHITAFQPAGNEDGNAQDKFGTYVAISGDFAIVGAPDDDDGAGLTDNGSATILKRNTTTGVWEIQGKLLNPAPVSDDEFGRSVAISGDYAIVGTPYDDEGAGLTNNGSATIFKRNAATGIWESQGKLVNPAAATNDLFGWSVAISGDYAIAGARGDDNSAGSATVFKRNAATGIWESQGKLFNATPVAFAIFGNSVGISGNLAIVGAPEDGAGSATIFKRNTTTGIWEPLPQGKLTGISTASFGVSVSISGNYAIIGDKSDPDDTGMLFIADGAATIFKRNTTTGVWELQVKLRSTVRVDANYFGTSVCIAGEYAIIGSDGDDVGAGITDNGSATIYKRSGSVWSLVQKFTRPNSNSGETFGASVAIDSTAGRFLIGAPGTQNGTGLVLFGKVK
ncbi:MAG: hypothetical protein V4722_00240 [Bacteroidota bacterium]